MKNIVLSLLLIANCCHGMSKKDHINAILDGQECKAMVNEMHEKSSDLSYAQSASRDAHAVRLTKKQEIIIALGHEIQATQKPLDRLP